MSASQYLVLLVFSGLLGLVIGSFLNVCIFRLPRNCMSIVKPRSRCPKCLNWIAWYDNLPVLSWVVLGGKCRHCKNPISVRYTLVELLTGVLFLYAGWRALETPSPLMFRSGPWISYRDPLQAEAAIRFALEGWFVSALIICTFVDLEFRIIPDEVSLSGIVIGLAAMTAFPFLCGSGGTPRFEDILVVPYRLDPNFALPWAPGERHLAALVGSLAGALLGAGALYLVGLLGKIVFRKRVEAAGEDTAMGFGDVKFMAMVGAVLGWRGVLYTFLIACLLGSLYGLGKVIVTRRMGFVPFGPFLSAGALTVLFWTPFVDQAIAWYLQLNHRLIESFAH